VIEELAETKAHIDPPATASGDAGGICPDLVANQQPAQVDDERIQVRHAHPAPIQARPLRVTGQAVRQCQREHGIAGARLRQQQILSAGHRPYANGLATHRKPENIFNEIQGGVGGRKSLESGLGDFSQSQIPLPALVLQFDVLQSDGVSAGVEVWQRLEL
jgi:hypothetical protein